MGITKLVRVLVELEEAFNRLPQKKNWRSFPGFVNEAVRLHLQEHQDRARRGIVEREEPGPDQ